MKLNEAGIELIKKFEGFNSKAYFDVGSVPTIGYGFTQGVLMGDTMTVAEADKRLESELAGFCRYVTRALSVDLTDNQFSAVICLVYNIGTRRFATSSILRLLNEKDFKGASLEFPRWDKVGGKEISGLLNRRIAEQALFLS